MSNTTDLTVANTILSQLGGSARLSAMIGAKNFSGGDNSLTFRFTAKSRVKVNSIIITLEDSDTYTVEFYWVRGLTVAKKSDLTLSGIYGDQLISAIENRLKLRLAL